ncbi:MAG: histidinol-phosphatase [Promethearchaeota archaeon]
MTKTPPPGDYHVHTSLCRHALGSMESYVDAAVAAGLPELGFNDHFPMFFLPSNLPLDSYAMSVGEFKGQYLPRVAELRKERAGEIRVLAGAEVDYYPGTEELVKKSVEKYELDYVYLSVHVLPSPGGAWCIDDERYRHVYEEKSVDAIWRQYLELLERAVRTGTYDVVAHLDLPKKFRHFPSSPDVVSDVVERLVEALVKTGTCVEINTSGWRKAVAEQYPSEDLVEILAGAGVGFVLGSDAHRPEEVGHQFDRAVELLKRQGVDGVVRFSRRKGRVVPL